MKRDLRWPVGIVVLLSVFVVANLAVMQIAGADPSFAIEPDYYRKAVMFDSTMAIERRSAGLRWAATSAIERGERGTTLTVALTDARGLPVSGASVTISARFNARANEVLSATLNEAAPGRYQSLLAAHHAGQWEVRIDARRGAERFVASTRAEAPTIP